MLAICTYIEQAQLFQILSWFVQIADAFLHNYAVLKILCNK